MKNNIFLKNRNKINAWLFVDSTIVDSTSRSYGTLLKPHYSFYRQNVPLEHHSHIQNDK